MGGGVSQGVLQLATRYMHGVLRTEHALDLCQWPLMAFEQVWPHRGGGLVGQKKCFAILVLACELWAAAPLLCSGFCSCGR